MSDRAAEYSGEEIGLVAALVEASSTEGIPPEEVADIQGTLGPIAIYDKVGIGEIFADKPEVKLDGMRQLQVLIYIQAAGLGNEGGWVSNGGQNPNKTLRLRIRDETGVDSKKVSRSLFELEERDCVELIKEPYRNNTQVISNARITEPGEQALRLASKNEPEVIVSAEDEIRQRLSWQVEAMRREVYYASGLLDIDRDLANVMADETAYDGSEQNFMTSDLSELSLAQLIRLPGRLERAQKDLEAQLDRRDRHLKGSSPIATEVLLR